MGGIGQVVDAIGQAGAWAAARPYAMLGAFLLPAIALRLPTLSFPLVEAHAFRQTQTAYTALLYHRQSIDLLHTPLPVLGPPWEFPFEFPLFQATAAMLMNAGVGTEVALRGTSLGFS